MTQGGPKGSGGGILAALSFHELWCVDFEFHARDGDRPSPVCLVARELRGGRLIRLWRDEMGGRPPYPVGEDSLFIAYYASAELGCHLALGWPLPAHVLDLFTEFRVLTNGRKVPCGNGLLGAMVAYGLDAMGVSEKAEMRDLILTGGPWPAAERAAILDYCQSDVDGLMALLPRMLPGILAQRHAPVHALLRGRFMAAAARMEHAGVPIDVATLARLRAGWGGIRARLIEEIDADYGVFEGATFKQNRFLSWLARSGIPWPLYPNGAPDLTDDTFRQMASVYPAVAPLRELRHALGQLRLNALAVGVDGRNRALLSPFRASSGRNAPSAAKFVFGPARWLRGLIAPPPGCGLAYCDWSSQEIGIAAALSGDPALIDAYRSGDPYLGFARQAGLAPPHATRASHGQVRERAKACVLGTNYGMGAHTLATRLGTYPAEARELLELHRRTYPVFWRWSDAAVDLAMTELSLSTVFGWTVRIRDESNPRSLRNFAMQANGAEMLRLACCLATERGIEVCAPIHDALLICAPLRRLEWDVAATRAAMAEASRVVLDGFELGTDTTIVRHPDRYMDARGEVMWRRVMALLRNPSDRRQPA